MLGLIRFILRRKPLSSIIIAHVLEHHKMLMILNLINQCHHLICLGLYKILVIIIIIIIIIIIFIIIIIINVKKIEETLKVQNSKSM